MKAINLAGKAATLVAWVLMFYNLAFPFDGIIGSLVTLLLAVTVLMHGLQLGIFHWLFAKRRPLKASDYLQVLIFGVFALLSYRSQALTSLEHDARQG